MNETCDREHESSLSRVLGKRALVYIGIILFAFALLLVVNSSTASAAGPTYVYDDISVNDTWTEADSPYIVNDSIAIETGVTLTIEQNVTVMVDSGEGILVGGTILADGTTDQPITFTANGTGYAGFWVGLTLNETSTASVFDNVIIEYVYEGLNIDMADVTTISNVDVLYSSYVGINWEFSGDLTTTMTNVNVSHGSYGIALWGYDPTQSLDFTATDITLWDLDDDAIWIETAEVNLDFTNLDIENVEDTSIWTLAFEGDATLSITDSLIWDTGDGVVVVANQSVDLTASNTEINYTGYGFDLFASHGNISVDISSVDFIQVGDTCVNMQANEGTISIVASGITIESCYLGIAATAAGDIDATVTDLEVDGQYRNTYLFTTEGDIVADFTDVDLYNTYMGIELWAPNGDIDATIDPSTFDYMNTGVQIDAGENASVVLEDTTFHDMGYGVLVYSGAGDAVVTVTNCTFDYTGTGLTVDANIGNADLMMSESIVNDTGTGVSLHSFDGDVMATFQDTWFGADWLSINAVTDVNDVNLWIENCSFMGDFVSSVMVDSADDAEIDVVNTTMNGYESESTAWYYPEEVSAEYQIIDPGVNRTSSHNLYVSSLPFDFPFAGTDYDSMRIYEDGYITLGGTYMGSISDFDGISTPIIAPCQAYFEADIYPQYGYKVYDDKVIVQWNVYTDSDNLRNVFEAVLYDNGDIQFNYNEMESVSHVTYDYGLNWASYTSLNLDNIYNNDPFDNDFTSIYMHYAPMSYGMAVDVEAENNITANLVANDISHYAEGGVGLHSSEGWISVDAQENSFHHIIGDLGYPPAGGISAWAENGTMYADVQDNSFSHIIAVGAVFVSGPDLGGDDAVVISNNTFTEVGVSGAVVAEIDDEYTSDPVDYTATHTFTNNVGVNSGMYISIVEIFSEDSAWNISTTQTVVNNTFTGIVKTYGMMTPIQPPSMWGITSFVGVHTETGESTVVSHIEIADNELEAVASGMTGIAAGVEVSTVGTMMDCTADISVQDNILAAPVMSFDTAIELFAGGYYNGTADLAMDVTVDVSGNEITSIPESESGIEMYLDVECESEPVDDSESNSGTVMSDMAITDNTLEGFEDGFDIVFDVWNDDNWGDMVYNQTLSITGNYLNVSDDAMDIDSDVGCWFSSYFPSVEEEIYSSVQSEMIINIMDNTVIAEDDGIDMYLGAYAAEDDRGTFNNAMVNITTMVEIAGNDITAEDGIDVYSYRSADDGEAMMVSQTLMDIHDNVVTAFETGEGDGVYVYEEVYADAYSSDYDDSPMAQAESWIWISDNQVTGFEVGIYAYHYERADYAQSHIATEGEIAIIGNTVTCTYGGVWGDAYGYAYNSADTNASIEMAFDITIDSNSVTLIEGDGYWGSPYLIYAGLYDDENVQMTGEIVVTDNNVQGLDMSGYGIGVYAYERNETTDVSITVAQNTIDLVEYGIEAWNCEVNAHDNVISNSGTGIWLDEANGTVSSNTIVDCGLGIWLDESNGTVSSNTIVDCEMGIDIGYSGDVVVEDNTLTTTVEEPYSGIYVLRSENVTLAENTISGHATGIYLRYCTMCTLEANEISGFMDYGIEVMSSNEIVVSNNTVEDSLGDGIYVYESMYITIEDNTVSDNLYDGMYIRYSDEVVIGNNTVTQNGDDGLYIYDSDAILYNGVFAENADNGVRTSSGMYLWIVDDSASVRNNDVSFYGDVIVQDGGELTLDTVRPFTFTGDGYDGTPHLTVEEGGLLTVSNSVIGSEDGPLNGYHYLFEVMGTLDMDNSVVSDAYELYIGPTASATIHASTIEYNLWNGIHVDNSSPVISGTDIESNSGSGVFIEGAEAAPVIKDCIIMDNDRGIYAYQTTLSQIVDNLIIGNDLAGVYAEEADGGIHDNIFLLNGNQIYLKNSDVTVEDNQIGYSELVQVMADYMIMGPMTTGFESTVSEWIISPEMISSIISDEIGIYAEDSTVSASDNVYGMLKYAVYVVDSELAFSDTVEENELVIPYLDDYGVMHNITLPIFVYDGVFASGSDVTVTGASIDVMDDALFLENCVAEVWNSELAANDFDIYAMDNTTCDVMSSSFDSVKAEDTSSVTVMYMVTVIATGSEGEPVSGVSVLITDAAGETVANGTTGADGKLTTYAVASEYTSEGKNTDMNPYTVNAIFEEGQSSQSFIVDGPVEVSVDVPTPEPWDTDPAIAMAAFAALLVGLLLLVIAKP